MTFCDSCGAEWVEEPLGELAAITMGQSPPSDHYNTVGDGVALIQGKADIEGHRTKERTWTTLVTKRCDAGDLILTVRAPVGSVAVARGDSCLGRGVCGLKPKGDTEFLYQALLFAENRWNRLEQGSTFTAANASQVRNFCILAPTHVRQQKTIAEVLSDVDRLIDSLDALIAKKRAIQTAMAQQLFGGKTRLPGFVDPWEPRRLADVGRTYGGLTGKKERDFGHGTGKYLTFLAVLNNVVVGNRETGQVHIAPTESQNLTRRGDVLFNGTSETAEDLALGAAVTAESEGLFLNSFCFGFRIRDPRRFLPVFLAYHFRSQAGRETVRKLAQGATRHNLSKRQFLSLMVCFPEREEQRAISRTMRDVDAEIEALEQRRDKIRALKLGMMQQLLTGRTRLVEPQATGGEATPS